VEEEKLRKTADMLLAGGKMLGVHCGKCLSPLFEFQGKIVCPVRGSETTPAKPEAKAPSLKKVEEVLHEKINALAEQLAGETDHAKTLELLERIKSALEALEKLRER